MASVVNRITRCREVVAINFDNKAARVAAAVQREIYRSSRSYLLTANRVPCLCRSSVIPANRVEGNWAAGSSRFCTHFIIKLEDGTQRF